MSDPVFLTIEQVKILNRIALDRYGGQDGVRDSATLESAVMHPCNVWLYGQDRLSSTAAQALRLNLFFKLVLALTREGFWEQEQE